MVFRWRRLKTSAVFLPYRLFFDYGMLSLRRGLFEHVKGLLDSFFSVGFFAGHEWKEEVAEHWDSFQVESFTCSQDLAIDGPVVGKEYNFNLVIDRHELKGMLGVEMVVTKENPDNHQLELLATEQFKLIKEEGSKLFFELKTTPSEAGLHKMGFRVYPVNKELPHRMDFAFVRWIQL